MKKTQQHIESHTTPGGITLTHKGHGIYEGNGWTLMKNPAMAGDIHMVKGPETRQKLFPLAQALAWIDSNRTMGDIFDEQGITEDEYSN